jgi:multiple sugar transport system substrate-binding protein
MRHEEAMEILQEFVDKALLANTNQELRIIHGKATGILRRAVIDKLRKYPTIKRIYHPEDKEGGDGVRDLADLGVVEPMLAHGLLPHGALDAVAHGVHELLAAGDAEHDGDAVAVDLAPLLAKEGDVAKLGYSPAILGLGFHAKVQCGLPFATSNPISYYNATLLKRAGLDPAKFPTTWDQVIADAQKVRALGDGNDGMFFRWPGDDWMFSALLYGHGGRMLNDAETDVAFNGAEGLAALRLLDRMVKEGGMPNYAGTADLQAFAAGKLGMMFRTTAQVRSIANSVGSNFELGTTIMPVIDAAKGRLPTGGAAAMITAKDPRKLEAAWKFVKFATSAEGTTLMVKNTGYVPCNQIAIDEPSYLGDFYKANPLFQAATRQVHLMVPWYAFPGANSVRVTQTMENNLARIAEQRATPEAVLADMATEVRRMLPRRS